MASKITQNDNNKVKKQVQEIQAVNGEDYQEWLYEQHQNYISENIDVITKALQAYKNKKNETQINGSTGGNN